MSDAVKSVGVIVGADTPTPSPLLRWLESDGHRVMRVADADALEGLVEQVTPDFIVVAPAPDGRAHLEICRAIRAFDTTCTTPVLVISRHSAVAERVAACRAGADEFLAMPFKAAMLRAHVRGLLALKNAPDRERARRRTKPRSTGQRPIVGE